MKALSSIRPVWGLLVGLGLFLISGSYTLRLAREEQTRIDRLKGTLEQLQELVRQTGEREDAMKRLAQGGTLTAEQLLNTVETPDRYRMEDSGVRELSEGYKHHWTVFHLGGVSPADLKHFLRQVENTRPPWRATRIEVETRDGALQGELHLESFQR